MPARFQWIAPVVTLLVGLVLITLKPAAVTAQVGPMSTCGGPDITTVPSAVTQDNYRGPFTKIFTVTNNCTTTFAGLELACEVTGPLACSGVVPTSRATLNPGQSFQVTATYSTGAPGSGTVLVRVTWGEFGGPGYGTLWVTVQAVTPPTVALSAPVLTSGSRAVVRNRTPMLRATILPATYPLDTTKTALLWRTDTVSTWRADSFTVARWNRGLMEWEVDSTLGLNGTGADSALVTVRACDTHSFCTIVTRYAVLPNDSTAVLSWLGTPTGTLGAAFGAPFGPGLSVSGAEVETGFSTIPYFAMGAPRSAGLVYSTRQSYPRVLVPVHVQLRWPTVGTPDQMVIRLFDGATKLDSLKLTSPSCSTGSALTCRAVLQGDFSGSAFPTPTRKWLKVEVEVTKGAVTKLSSDSVEAVLVDRRSTMYGSGWWPSAFLKLVQAGSDRLLISPTGTASIYRGNGDSLYLPPAGSFVGLIRTATGWDLRARGDSAVLRFDSNGRLRAARDRNNNVDSLVYGASGLDTLKSLRGTTAHTITLAYTSGLLSTITDAAGRVTKVIVGASNQLSYDSLSSPTATPITHRYLYQSYPGTNTNLLIKRIGVILDTTIVVYDSTFKRRPVQALLPLVQNPAGSWVKPAISYTAVERRGFGALVRTDSAGPYVEIKDPLDNWTRSWLNRWGQARLSWDTLGLLGRSRFADDGRVLWSQGKIGGDTTRTYFSYDAFQRLAKSYINRIENGKGILRLDSLVYDGNHRVVKRVDSRGQVDSLTYDTKGNVLKTRDPGGFVTTYWYGSRGLLDSVLPPSTSVKTWFRYDGTWRQRVATRIGPAATSTLLDSTTYDSYGRASASLQKVRVRITASVTKWQWRRSTPFYRVTNQADSAIVARTDECDPCNSPPAFGTDAAHTIKVGFRFDRAGRDSLRLASNDLAKATRYLYDRLNRTVSRRPPSPLPTPPRDSTVYDLAGNVVKTITRRGDQISATYDSRNRAITMAVPGVGTYTRVYAGPLDQLTRFYIASAVDSIGGVNGEVRYGYDRRGRLLADTSYTGIAVRPTTHLYDFYERDSVATDGTGSWQLHYEAQRGMISTVLTPFGDSTSYTFDGQGRLNYRRALSSGPIQEQAVFPTATGSASRIDHTVNASPTWAAGTYDPEGTPDEPTMGPALGPLWVEQHGAGTAPDSSVDSLRYDGWERLLSWRQYKNPPPHWALSASDTVSFDVDGNILTPTGSESYEVNAGRLLSRVDALGWTWTYAYDAAGNQTQASA